MSGAGKAFAIVLGVVGLCRAGVMASGTRMPNPTETLSPEERAAEAYNSGIAHKDKGIKIEQAAQTASAQDREKADGKARKEFEKALKDFGNAASLSPKLYQAYNGMGFAYRKTGDYTKALEMYDKALDLAPGFPDAIEYRGEAYLALNRIEDVKQSYLSLFASDRTQADTLMTAMNVWLEKRRAEPAGVDPAALSGFESWLRQRSELSRQTASMALHAPRSRW